MAAKKKVGNEPARRRDREGRERAILDAAKTLLAEGGFHHLGVNAIAKSAGCDKQLIYRYFGGLEGVVEAIADDLADWVEGTVRLEGDPETYADAVAELLISYARALRNEPLMRNMAVWELAEASPLTRMLSERRGAALSKWIGKTLSGIDRPSTDLDVGATNAVLIASVQYLTLAAASTGRAAGVELDDAGWARIEKAVRALCSASYQERD